MEDNLRSSLLASMGEYEALGIYNEVKKNNDFIGFTR